MKRILAFASIVIIFATFLAALVLIGRANFSNLKNTSSVQVNAEKSQLSTQDETEVSTPSAKTQSNFLVDPSFEEKSDAWYSHENWHTNHIFDSKIKLDGNLSALLSLDSKQSGSQSTRVYGVVQDLTPKVFPNFLSGNYYVEGWKKVTEKQYLQAVVIVIDPDNLPVDIRGGRSYQIRYILSGQEEAPLDLKNAKYIILNDKEPVQNKWVHFERDIAKDFKEQWGDTPKKFSSIRVFFEARWDGRTSSTPVTATVRYDDLFVGIK